MLVSWGEAREGSSDLGTSKGRGLLKENNSLSNIARRKVKDTNSATGFGGELFSVTETLFETLSRKGGHTEGKGSNFLVCHFFFLSSGINTINLLAS